MDWELVGLTILLAGILCIAVIAGYRAHRLAIRKNQDEGIPGPVDVNTPRMVRDLVLRPDDFFRTVSEGPAALFMPILWLMIAGGVMALGLMAGSDAIILKTGLDKFLFLNLLALVLMITAVVLAWAAASGIFQALGHLSGGSGSFQDTLRNTGYGLAPGFLIYGLFLLLGAIALTVLQVPPTPFGSPVPNNPLVAGIKTGGFLVATILAFVLMTHGLRYAQKISLAKAAVSVGVPVLIFAVFVNLQYLAPA